MCVAPGIMTTSILCAVIISHVNNICRLLYMVVPVYSAEISPERSRGKLSSTIGPMFAGGLLVAFAVNLGCVELEFGWRISLGLQSAFAVVFVFGMMVLPRTPRYIIMLYTTVTMIPIVSKPHTITIL